MAELARRPLSAVRTPQSAALTSGALAGIAGFAVFLAVHAVWIVPIWFIAPVGVLIAAVTGLCVGWAYDVHRGRLASSIPLRVLTLFAAAALVLLPAEPIALRIAPVDLMSRSVDAWRGVTALALFFVIAISVGAAGGALVGRSRGAAGVTALAAFGLAWHWPQRAAVRLRLARPQVVDDHAHRNGDRVAHPRRDGRRVREPTQDI